MSMNEAALWETAESKRFFLVPAGIPIPPGSLELRDRLGRTMQVDPAAMQPFEISEEHAVRWAKEHLGAALDELKQSLHASLATARARIENERRTPVAPDATVTPNAVP